MRHLQVDGDDPGVPVAPGPTLRPAAVLKAGSDPTEEALDAIFGHASPSVAETREVPTEPEGPDQSFARILKGLQAQIGPPANDDRIAARERAAPWVEARLGTILIGLVAAGLLGLASGLVSQLDLGVISRNARWASWAFAATGGILLASYLHALTRWQERMHRRQEQRGRRAVEEAAQREQDLAGQTELLRMRTADMAARLAELRLGIEELRAATGQHPDPAAIVARQEALAERLVARFAAQERVVAATLAGLREDIASSAAMATGTAERVAELAERHTSLPEPPAAAPAAYSVSADPLVVRETLRAFVARGADEATRAATGALLDRIFDVNGLLLAWECYRARGTAAFDQAYRADGLRVLPAVRLALDTDAAFREETEGFFRTFEAVLTESARDKSDAALMRRLCSIDGRCYTLLAHASGRIASADMRD